ncbi:rhodanese-like domain-containing protein [Candidatus Atelocyanobacterium thalassae]|uniref:Rhodanese-related sulfurtransferase n=2 Tax=Candidatus Atelocyanobacterium thalassae TaxID=713887 RepID=A0A086CH60_9CHRO|nr:rhodanese-like domain-containing protein [Candidatus Atelocyanobacterium thalassa]KFF41524.1 MAG: Rhodanese-related sulfurtransferase [Candidatus Atelocyanobacterium thalassa isolate SIO64986]BDA39551.1 thiosulfate sulfurtransferase GlpE [cyanobacterium endosymbiont of Braarudosphaera bigelowii]
MSQNQSISTITVKELAEYLVKDSSELQLIDVREPEEVKIASIKGFKIFSLSQFHEWSKTIIYDLDFNKETLVLCHHGVRSSQMCFWLLQTGFLNVKNIQGGIAAYSSIIDNSIPQY